MHVGRDSCGLMNYWKVGRMGHALSKGVSPKSQGILSPVIIFLDLE